MGFCKTKDPDYRPAFQPPIAYGIAKACHREGAQLAFTYVNDKPRPRGGHGGRIRQRHRLALRRGQR